MTTAKMWHEPDGFQVWLTTFNGVVWLAHWRTMPPHPGWLRL